MFDNEVEIIKVRTILPDDTCRDTIETECWFTAMSFVKDALQSDLNLTCEVSSWTVMTKRSQ